MEKTIEIIPKGKIISIQFATDIIGSLRTALEAERELRKDMSDEKFSELVVSLCKFESDCDIKDYSFKMVLYFIARFESQCKEDNIFEKVTQEEFNTMVKESTPNS